MQTDREKIAALIEDTLRSSFNKQHQLHISALHQSSNEAMKHFSTHQTGKRFLSFFLCSHSCKPNTDRSISIEGNDRGWVVADTDCPSNTSGGPSTPGESHSNEELEDTVKNAIETEIACNENKKVQEAANESQTLKTE